MMSDNFPVLSNEYAKFLRRISQTMERVSVSTSVSHMIDAERYFENIFIGYLDPWHECIVVKTNNNVLVKPKPFYEDILHLRIRNIKHKTFDIIVNEDEFLF